MAYQDLLNNLFSGGLLAQDVGLPPDVQQRAQQQALLTSGLDILANSGKRRGPPRSLAELVGSGLQAGQQGYRGALQDQMQVQDYRQRAAEKKALNDAAAGADFSTAEGWKAYGEQLQRMGRTGDAKVAFERSDALGKKSDFQQKMSDLQQYGIDPNSAEGKKYLGTYVDPKSGQNFINAGDGNIYDAGAGRWIRAPGGGTASFRTLSPDEVKTYGLPAGTVAQIGPNGKIDVVTRPQDSGRVPSTLIKLESEDIADLMTAKNTANDLASLRSQIEKGTLNLGPMANAASATKNFFGLSDANSQNYASFRASLEKLRNDSLRLNKGVQTEGDSIRAWNELLANINDENVVKKRLVEIENLNRRAEQERMFIIQQRRSAVNAPEFDPSTIPSAPSAYTDASQPAGADLRAAAAAELKRRLGR